jgi:V8-like Glu-specific endopeptidase
MRIETLSGSEPMKDLDVHVCSSIVVCPKAPFVALPGCTPKKSLPESDVQEILKKQKELLALGERGQLNDIRKMACSYPRLEGALLNSRSVGILVADGDLRHESSTLGIEEPCFEARLGGYGAVCNIHSEDMLRPEPWWPTALGTCFLVGDQTIMTARHIFRDNRAFNALTTGNLRVVFDYQFKTDNQARRVFCRGINCFDVVKTNIDPCAPIHDAVALDLTKSATKSGERTALTISKDSLSEKTPVYSLGHPMNVTQRYAYTAESLQLEQHAFRAWLDAYDGSSGSPVFSATSHKVIGLVKKSSQSAPTVESQQTGLRVSQLCLPAYAETATLCVSSAAFPAGPWMPT